MLDKLINNKRSFLIANYSFWLIVIVISASQLYLRFRGNYDGGWFNFFWRQAVAWIGWAALTPIITGVVSKIQSKPLDRRTQTIAHISSAIIFTLAYVFILSILSVIFFDSSTPLMEFIRTNIISATVTNLLVYALIAAFGFTLVFYRKTQQDELLKHELGRKNQELEKQLVDFQLSTLKMQIQPHFLFNALHSVSSLVRKGMNEKAIDTIALISDLLRNALSNEHREFVRLEEEVEILQKYLSIEEIRFGENLVVDYHIEESSLSSKVPFLILQPVVENIFKHAFKDQQKGYIEVFCRKENELLEIKIKDNGTGLKDGFNSSHDLGIGLNNIKNRLHTIYGDSAKFNISNRQGSGTSVTILLPSNPQE